MGVLEPLEPEADSMIAWKQDLRILIMIHNETINIR